MSIQASEHELHGSPCSSLGSSFSKKRSREDAGFDELTTPPPSRRCSREADDRPRASLSTYYTPPASETGSPSVKSEGFQGSLSQLNTSDVLPVRSRPQYEPTSPPQTETSDALDAHQKEQRELSSAITLPSLQEFDQGVQALVDTRSPPSSSPSQSLPSLKTIFDPQLPSLQLYAPRQALPTTPAPPSTSPYPSWRYSEPAAGDYASAPGQLSLQELYPHTQPTAKANSKHCNKKYTIEEGHFIIYLWHDKNLSWAQVRDEFARMFGSEPMRTTQGLQAWYYRTNLVIPCWDSEGYLLFDDNVDILEPLTREVKCRSRGEGHGEPGPMGLAQRYPESAMTYPWVEHKDKVSMADWAAKRAYQYNERRTRREQKETQRAADLQESSNPRHIQQAVRYVAPDGYRSRL